METKPRRDGPASIIVYGNIVLAVGIVTNENKYNMGLHCTYTIVGTL